MNDRSISIFPSETFLDARPYQYGWEQCKPLRTCGPSMCNNYLFYYVISGKGWLDVQSENKGMKHYNLKAGEGFLICPGQISTYCANSADPWKYVWLEFGGLRVPGYMDRAGLGIRQPIYHSSDNAASQQVRDLMLYIADHASSSPLHLVGYLYLFLDALVQSSNTSKVIRGTRLKDYYIQEAVTYMEQHYQRDLTVEELADVCGLNRNYFSRLFKECMGCPPQEFLILLRLSKASEMMRTSDAPIGEISVLCGYPNPLHFSRAFKKQYGIPPREWREKNKIL